MIGYIYILVCNITLKLYVGSTILRLKKRYYGHITDYKRRSKRSVASFEIVKNNDFDIYQIEEYSFTDIKELRKREGYWIKKLDCVNKRIEGQTRKEWRDNSETYKKYLDRTKEKKKQYMKEWRNKNIEYVKQKNKEKWEKNKEKYKERINRRYICPECKANIRYGEKWDHVKTKKHKNNVIL